MSAESVFDQNKLRYSKVLVVGAGALGNEVIKNLALAGVGSITIIDSDRVEKSNLSKCILFRVPSSEFGVRNNGTRDLVLGTRVPPPRPSISNQDRRAEGPEERMLGEFKVEVIKKSLKELVPEVEVEAIAKNIEDMPEDFVSGFDVVLGCVDNIEARLHINAQCYYHKVPYIDGGIDGLSGKVQVVLPRVTPCIQCGMNGTHRREMDKHYSCTGGKRTVYKRPIPTEITTASVIGAVQVREALKLICETMEDMIKNYIFYDGLNNEIESLNIMINPNCIIHIKDQP
jgi:molybdopterin/thiamine biosynthesis adenylyltransferase